MAVLDHIILKVNDLGDSVAIYTGIFGFSNDPRHLLEIRTYELPVGELPTPEAAVGKSG